MSDMNNNIGDKPYIKPAQATAFGKKEIAEPLCDCKTCEETQCKTDLRLDPREAHGRSQVKVASKLTPEMKANIEESLGDFESLDEIRKELIKGGIKMGLPPELAAQHADEIILDTFAPVPSK